MSKIRKLSQSINQIDFETSSDKFELYYQNFLNSDLGYLYQSIPWSSLTKSFSKKIKAVSADNIYAANANRRLVDLLWYPYRQCGKNC